jgi:quinol monooxygenase YgiN
MRNLMWLALAAVPFALPAGPVAAQAQGAVYVVTYIELQAASAKSGAALLKQYRDGARKEDGNLEAELGQELGRPNRFLVIEGWRDRPAFDAHQNEGATTRIHDALKGMQHSPPDQRINTGFDLAPANGKGALIVETHIDVIPPRREATEAALRAEAAAARQDRGNVQWDVLQQLAPQTNHFNVFAVWGSQADFAAYDGAPHRAKFRETMAPMLGALYDERLYRTM